jgi:hypothetical protein
MPRYEQPDPAEFLQEHRAPCDPETDTDRRPPFACGTPSATTPSRRRYRSLATTARRGPGPRGLGGYTAHAAAVVGILLCIACCADLLALAGLTTPLPWVGPIVTGLLIGRDANFVHDFATRWM